MPPFRPEFRPVGVPSATFGLLADWVTTTQSFVTVFTYVYLLVIFVYIITTFVRLPHSLQPVQRFLYDVSEPYLRLFRRILPPLGPLDLSPVVAIVLLFLLKDVIDRLFDQFS